MTTELGKPNQEKKPKRGGPQLGSGRPKFVPTVAERQLVATLSGRGLPQDQIAIPSEDWDTHRHAQNALPKRLLGGKANANSKIRWGAL